MKTIYIDSDFMCHVENREGRTAIETDVFDNHSDEYIKGYRYVPYGHTWTRSDGEVFHGLMVCSAVDYNQLLINVAVANLSDTQAEEVTSLFENWEVGVAYVVGDRRQYNGLLYRCVQAHTSQADWTPDITPALWVRTSTEEWPEWIHPTGAHDAYNKGDKVSHNEKHWISSIDANVYEPGVYGWDEAE